MYFIRNTIKIKKSIFHFVPSRYFFEQSLGCYLRESVKALFINQLTTLPMATGLLYVVKKVGPMSFIYFWLARCILGILRETFYMTLIAPYFQKLYPLPNNRLR